MVRKLRVGTVSYLNSVPLNEGLDADPTVELTRAVPSRLADQLAAGEIDVGLIPVIEAARDASYRIVPNAAIACTGEVQTVRLYSHVPLDEITSVALDPSSRTSVALTRVLLEGTFKRQPAYVALSNQTQPNTVKADAFLLIGDPVFTFTGSVHTELDLGQAWYEATGLPFVFAVWAARADVPTDGLAERFLNAKRLGMARIDEIARRESVSRKLSESLCRRYLTEMIEYDLTDAHLSGWKWFLHLASEYGIIDRVPDIDAQLLGA